MSREVDVYLDVDGVVLPVVLPEDETRNRGGWNHWAPLPDRPERYAPAMIEGLRELADMPGVTLRWLTAWGTDAIALGETIGLPGLEVVDADNAFRRAEGTNYSAWWKRDAIQAEHAKRPHNAIAWVDDDLAFDATARRWVGDLRRVGLPVIAQSPDTTRGLTIVHVAALIAFVRNYTGA